MSETKKPMYGTCQNCGRSAQRDKTLCRGCYHEARLTNDCPVFVGTHDTCSNCGHRMTRRDPADTETRCKPCLKKGLCPKKNCHWTMDDIEQSRGKHTHCGYCALVCCLVCQGCTTRDCSCEEATRCPCRRRR